MRTLIRQGRAAVLMQCCVRKRQAWLETQRRRAARELARRNKAASDIQRIWLGNRGRHIYALLLGLKHLKTVEENSARRIQNKYRMYRARKFMRAVRAVQASLKHLNDMATRIQKAFRGLKGRQLFEVREL
jgi:hypothetical protein